MWHSHQIGGYWPFSMHVCAHCLFRVVWPPRSLTCFWKHDRCLVLTQSNFICFDQNWWRLLQLLALQLKLTKQLWFIVKGDTLLFVLLVCGVLSVQEKTEGWEEPSNWKNCEGGSHTIVASLPSRSQRVPFPLNSSRPMNNATSISKGVARHWNSFHFSGNQMNFAASAHPISNLLW